MANNQAKRVLIFSTAYFPLVGGAEVAVKEITDRVKDFQFDMITAKIKPGLVKFERIGNVNVYRVGFGSNFDKYRLPFLGLKKAIQLEKENQYKLTWSIMASFGGFLGLRFKKKYPNKPWLLTLQEGDPPEEILKKVGVFENKFHQIFQEADYFQAISGFLYQWAIQMGAKEKKGTIIPNGVDVEKFKRIDGQDDRIIKLRKKLDIKDKNIILTVSRLVKKNGIDDLIKAGQYLDFSFKILIIGSGEQEKELKDLTEKLNLEDKVNFLGHIDYNDLPKYYSVADVFVRPSRSEGLGNAFLEAMSCGVPFVGTDVGGIPDFKIDKRTGKKMGLLVSKKRTPKEIAENIKKIVIYEVLGDYNARDLIKREYSWDIIARKMGKIYQKLS